MSDSDKTLKLRIELDGYVMPGAAEAEAKLKTEADKLAASLGVVNVSAAEAERILKQTGDSGSAALAGVKKEAEHAGEAAHGGNKHHGETRLLFSEINKIVPGLGHALHAAFSGPLGPIILVGIAIAEVKEKLKAYNEELDKVGEYEVEEHQKSIEALATAWDDAKKEMGDYYAELATAGEEKDPIKKQLENIKKLRDAQSEAHKKELEELQKLEIAYLKSHGATPDQISQVEARQKQDLATLAAKKESADGVGDLEEEQRRRNAAAAGLDADYHQKQEHAEYLEGIQDRLNRDKTKLEDQQNPASEAGKAAAKKREEAEKNLKWAENMPDYHFIPGVGNAVPGNPEKEKEVKKAKEEMESVDAEEAARKKRIEEIRRGIELNEEHVKTAEIRAKTAHDASIENQTRRTQLPGEIEQARKIQAVHDQERTFEAAAGDIPGNSRAGSHITDHRGGYADAIHQLQQSQADGRKLADEARKAAAAHADNLPAIRDLLIEIRKSNEQLQQQINNARNSING